jgi:hypothetical protein
VVNTINAYNRPNYKSKQAMLADYFKQPSMIVPQKQEKFYKFNVGDRVVVALSPLMRRSLSFKFSLFPGKNRPPLFLKHKINACF